MQLFLHSLEQDELFWHTFLKEASQNFNLFFFLKPLRAYLTHFLVPPQPAAGQDAQEVTVELSVSLVCTHSSVCLVTHCGGVVLRAV